MVKVPLPVRIAVTQRADEQAVPPTPDHGIAFGW